ncbi:MAG TPA: hypothetical protein VKB81_01340 [Nitrospira sp.]|nr:hypothetical protein [Nitrospira sp.]
MRWIRPGKAIVFIVLLVTLGCRGGAQLYQVRDAPVQTATGHPASLDQIQKAIIDAGASLGWIMAVAKPGEIVATLNLRSHTAIVTIPFTSKNYSILYKDSTNLKYDSEKQTIHENYNGWIQRLDNTIRTRIAAIG